MYVYIKTESALWTVGHYDPRSNKFIPESDHDNPEDAASRVARLNGSSVEGVINALEKLVRRCDGPEGVRADGSNIDTLEAAMILKTLKGY